MSRTSLDPHPNKAVRSRAMQKIYFATAAPATALSGGLVPKPCSPAAVSHERSPHPGGAEMPPYVRRRLERVFRDDIARLGDLIDRDLSGWITTSRHGE